LLLFFRKEGLFLLSHRKRRRPKQRLDIGRIAIGKAIIRHVA
jgi:hypothetical protein